MGAFTHEESEFFKVANTPEHPWPVREVNAKVKSWVERLGHIWVEGQLTQVNMKPSWKLSYLTLRDTEAEASVQVTCATTLLRGASLCDGDRVIAYAKTSLRHRFPHTIFVR